VTIQDPVFSGHRSQATVRTGEMIELRHAYPLQNFGVPFPRPFSFQWTPGRFGNAAARYCASFLVIVFRFAEPAALGSVRRLVFIGFSLRAGSPFLNC
jgi:hypothetical protein